MLSSILTVAIPVLGALSVALVAFVIVSRQQERVSARDALSQLQEFEIVGDRDKSLLVPLRTRLLGPAAGVIEGVGKKFSPPDYVAGVKDKHLRAGIDKTKAVESFLFQRAAFILAIVPIALIIFFVPLPFFNTLVRQIGLVGFVAVGAFVLPNKRLDAKVEEREVAIRRALPDTLDLLTICVESGLGFDQAVDRVVENVPGPLSREFARMLGEVTAGSSRADALRNLQERINSEEVRSFVLAMIQADTFGVSIGRVLRGQADEMRIRRRQEAQEKAQKAPVKMLIPMVFCIFPSLFIVILGPAALSILETFNA